MSKLVLTEVWTYPIKSLGGIQAQTARVVEKGLELDRRWMLIDENGQFMSQRRYPKMALFKLSMDGNEIAIRYGSDVTTVLPAQPSASPPMRATVWDDEVTVVPVSDDHDQWFSQRLGTSCRLVHFPEINRRPVDPDFQRHGEQVSLADGYPFLIIGQASLDGLNERLPDTVPMNRFRPNFVFAGASPHEEDTWQDFTIGDVSFAGVKPCARCTIPTVDQDTAERGPEPSRTLATYRRKNNNVYFGMNLIALSAGNVRVGDPIIVKSYHVLPTLA